MSAPVPHPRAPVRFCPPTCSVLFAQHQKCTISRVSLLCVPVPVPVLVFVRVGGAVFGCKGGLQGCVDQPVASRSPHACMYIVRLRTSGRVQMAVANTVVVHAMALFSHTTDSAASVLGSQKHDLCGKGTVRRVNDTKRTGAKKRGAKTPPHTLQHPCQRPSFGK